MRSNFAILQELAVPTGAAPGTPGWRWTNDIPQELADYYGPFGTSWLAVVELNYSIISNTYQYRGIQANGNVVYGGVVDGVVDEIYRTDTGFGVHTIWYALLADAGFGVNVNFGRNGLPPTDIDDMQWSFQTCRLRINTTVEWDVDQHQMFRGWKARADSAASSAAIGAETVVLTTGSFTAKDGRAYRISWRGRFASSAAQTATMRLRRTNAAGQLLDVWQWIYGAAQSLPFHNQVYVKRAAGAGDLSTTIALTLQASAGTNTNTAAATDVRYVQVDDAGSAADYTNAIALV